MGNQQPNRYEGFFADLANDSPYLKACAEGLAKSGKTFTLALIAAGLHGHIKSKKPIVIFDTENASKFLRPMFQKAGINVQVKRSRTLPDLKTAIDFCQEGGSDILFIDSMTHVWRYFVEDYQKKMGRKSLEFRDWNTIKPLWGELFTDPFVHSHVHILFTGRQGYTWEYEEIDGKKQIVKTGVKMKIESETAYEPDLVLHLERFEEILASTRKNKSAKRVWRECTVIGSRLHELDGKVFQNARYKDFEPIVQFLLKDVSERKETPVTGNDTLFSQNEDRSEQRTQRQVQLERNIALLDKVAAGSSGDAKALRMALIEHAYMGETSDTAIGTMSVETLEDAHGRLFDMCKVIEDIQIGEGIVFLNDKTRDKARGEQIGQTNLGKSNVDHLQKYAGWLKLTAETITARSEEEAKKKEMPAATEPAKARKAG